MRIAVLGPLEVLTDDATPVVVPDPAGRLLLAVLAAGAPGAVGTDQLMRALGDGSSPEALHVHLSGLRAALQPGLPPRSSGQYVLRRGAGYVLAVGRSDVDALRFESLVGRGRAELAAGDPAEAVRLLTAALALWRGEPYADWPGAAFAEAERRRLTGLHAEALEELADARSRPRREPAPPPPLSAFPVPRRPEPPAERPAPGEPGTLGDHLASPSPPPAAPRSRTRRAVLVAGLVAALVAAGLAVRSQREVATVPPTAADPTGAERTGTIVARQDPIDISLLLAVAAVRADDHPETRHRLLSVLGGLGRVERVVPFPGLPHAPALSGGGALTFRNDRTLLQLTADAPEPRVILPVPGEWGAWLVAAPSPTDPVLLAAGENLGGPWLRTISTVDGTSRLLLAGDRLGGRPVDAVVTPDGRRALLLLAEYSDNARWRVLEVDLADGSPRDTRLRGVVPAASDALAADFSDDAERLAVWDVTRAAPATLIDVGTGRRTAVAAHPRPARIAGYVAMRDGALQLWDDGAVSRIDADGINVQDLVFHDGQVRDVVVPREGDWAVTAGDGGEVVRWDVDSSTGTWRRPERLTGHGGAVVGAEADPAGRRLYTVSLDERVIAWDMRDLPYLGGIREERARRFPFMRAADQLEEACAVVGRDLTPAEWSTYLPEQEYEPTCSDLP
jgi:hypothetical protein